MLSKQEQDFLRYWEDNRLKKKKFLRQFSIGLPLSVLIVAVLFVNILSGWYKRADMVIRSNSSVIVVVIIAAIGIAIFMTIFSSKHKWDQNEQRYQELKLKETKTPGDATETH
jgi:uncharacterized membrane protein